MTAFVALRALGWCQPVPPPVPIRYSDPTGDAITRALVARKLWRNGVDLGLTREGGRISVRIFLRDFSTMGDRSIGAGDAAKVRATVVETLSSEGWEVRFTDALFCERDQRGWAVLASARRRG